jgi:hypothetical protein
MNVALQCLEHVPLTRNRHGRACPGYFIEFIHEFGYLHIWLHMG